jgi:hypothetical protein
LLRAKSTPALAGGARENALAKTWFKKDRWNLFFYEPVVLISAKNRRINPL